MARSIRWRRPRSGRPHEFAETIAWAAWVDQLVPGTRRVAAWQARMIDLSDAAGQFEIRVAERDVSEVDVLRLEAAAGRRAATFLKHALGYEKVMSLLSAAAKSTVERWQDIERESAGALRARVTTFGVVGLSADDFWTYVTANAGPDLQFAMHPEHYVSHFPEGLSGPAIIAEPWGSAMIVSHAGFCEPAELVRAGIVVDGVWEEDARYRVAAIGRAANGTFLCAILHQIIPNIDGFRFKTCAFLPRCVPEGVLAGMADHALVEFINMIRIARDGVARRR